MKYNRLNEPNDCPLATKISPANGVCHYSTKNEFPWTKIALVFIMLLQMILALILIKFGLNQYQIRHKVDDISAGRLNRQHNIMTASIICASFNSDKNFHTQKEQVSSEIYVTPEEVRFISNNKKIRTPHSS